MLRIAHLVDDTTAGGVTRYLDFLRTDPVLAETARHEVAVVSRTNPARLAIDADLIVSHLAVTWRGLPGLMALRARHAGVPLIHVEHSYSEAFTAANVTARGRFHRLLRTAYALFDRVVAVSDTQAEWLRRRDLVQAGALSVIESCVDLAPVARVPPARGAQRTIGAVGRFESQKGFDILIRAFRTVDDPDLRLVLFGDGSERATLEALAAGDPRISFPGFTARPEDAYAQCDIIAMPSRWEPYGLVALEANAAGRPVLLSRVDGLRDQLRAGNVSVAENTADGWADALRAVGAEASGVVRPDVARSHVEATRRKWLGLVGELLGEARADGHGSDDALAIA